MLVKGCMNNQNNIKRGLALLLSVIERCLAALFPINQEQLSCTSNFEFFFFLLPASRAVNQFSKEKNYICEIQHVVYFR